MSLLEGKSYSTSRRLQVVLASLLVFGTVFAVFFQVQSFQFLNFDDPLYVTENQHVLQGVTKAGVQWAFTAEHSGHWQPLTYLSHMLDVELFGLDPGAHHLVNVCFHALNTFLVFLFLYLVTGWFFESIALALLFGVHPMRIESVAWISERKDVLSIFFLLSALVLYVKFTVAKGLYLFWGAVLFFVTSLLCKPTGVVFPALLLLLDVWPLKRISEEKRVHSFRKLLVEKVPFVIGAVFCSIAAVLAQGKGGGLKSLVDYPIAVRLDNVLIGFTTYLWKLFVPSDYAIFYPFKIFSWELPATALVVLALISAIAVFYRKKFPALLTGWMWFGVALLPVIGVVQIGGQSYADRWSYLAHLGLLLPLAVALRSLSQRRGAFRIVATVTVGLYVSFFGATTVKQLPNWRDSESIFRHTLKVSPGNFMAHTNLGAALEQQGRIQEAKIHFEAAVRLAPLYPTALVNLANVRAREERFVDAEELLLRALNRRASFRPAFIALGTLYETQGRFIEAISMWLEMFVPGREDPLAKARLESLVATVWGQECSGIVSSGVRDLQKTAFYRIRERLHNWPEPSYHALKMGLEKVVECDRHRG